MIQVDRKKFLVLPRKAYKNVTLFFKFNFNESRICDTACGLSLSKDKVLLRRLFDPLESINILEHITLVLLFYLHCML